ncbi:NADPH-dependent F420 reductase [Robiginitalea sediminis]|uniref:NADPH-dependent F420 reductase n=1 Tax=Robiginitalea sediminis TaxID=1982593 RepID=UPI000B4A61F3|nr:NAD(P)-binding domain-containing protein [Robiginitalea sediminis]
MKITIIGSGVVGQTLAAAFHSQGHQVWMATRNPDETAKRTVEDPQSGESFAHWHAENPGVTLVSFGQVPDGSEVLVNATGGMVSLDALDQIGADKIGSKVLLDVANPLDFSQGFPPTLAYCNTDSLGERIQQRFPGARVVKALNTVNFRVMVQPDIVPGAHNLFMCGDDPGAKEVVLGLLASLGWPRGRVLDLGGIGAARGTEMLMPLWLGLMVQMGSPIMNFEIRRP